MEMMWILLIMGKISGYAGYASMERFESRDLCERAGRNMEVAAAELRKELVILGVGGRDVHWVCVDISEEPSREN